MLHLRTETRKKKSPIDLYLTEDTSNYIGEHCYQIEVTSISQNGKKSSTQTGYLLEFETNTLLYVPHVLTPPLLLNLETTLSNSEKGVQYISGTEYSLSLLNIISTRLETQRKGVYFCLKHLSDLVFSQYFKGQNLDCKLGNTS